MAGYDLTQAYQDASQSKYADYIPKPVYDWRDSLFGWATGSMQKKQNEWAQAVKNLELQDKSVERQVQQLEAAGINPYAVLGSGGSQIMFSGSSGYDQNSGTANSGSNVFKDLFMASFGALMKAATKSDIPAMILTSGSKVFGGKEASNYRDYYRNHYMAAINKMVRSRDDEEARIIRGVNLWK